MPIVDNFLRFIISRKMHQVKNKFNRVLPINELFVDRWEKAKFLGFGNNTSVYDSAIVIGNVSVGSNTWIGPNTLLDGTGELTIGSGCDISAGVHLYSHDTVDACISGNKKLSRKSRVSIGNNTYIGPMSIVSMGVEIGSHCIICANSFVNSNFEDNSIIAGTPAKKIGHVEFNPDTETPVRIYE